MNLNQLFDLLKDDYNISIEDEVLILDDYGIKVLVDDNGFCEVSGNSRYEALPRDFVISSELDLEVYIYPFVLQCIDGIKRV